MCRKVMHVQVLDKWHDTANRWQTQPKRRTKTTAITANMFKTKRALSESWAELSPAHRGKRWRRTARRGRWRRRRGGGGVGWSSTRQKSAPRGKSRQRQKTRQTVQLRTSKIHKTRRQAGGLHIQISIQIVIFMSKKSSILSNLTVFELMLHWTQCLRMGWRSSVLYCFSKSFSGGLNTSSADMSPKANRNSAASQVDQASAKKDDGEHRMWIYVNRMSMGCGSK